MALYQTRSGGLTRMITIQQATATQDVAGQPIKTWTRLDRAWAAVESIDTNERFQGIREVGHKLRLFTIRYRSDINFEQRIVYQEEYYNIRSIKEVNRRGRDAFLELLGELIEGAEG